MNKGVKVALGVGGGILAVLGISKLVSSSGPPTGQSQLVLKSSPSGANIFINNAEAGVTNRSINLDPGSYDILLQKEGYEDYIQTVTLEEGQTVTIDAALIAINEATGTLIINSDPTGADLFIDSKAAGTTPYNQNIRVGTHYILIRSAGYLDWETDVVMEEGRIETINAYLHPEEPGDGDLNITTIPSGAEITVECIHPPGQTYYRTGISPLSLNDVPTGNYQIYAKKSGYYDKATQQLVSAGEVTNLEMTLEPIGIPPEGDGILTLSGLTGQLVPTNWSWKTANLQLTVKNNSQQAVSRYLYVWRAIVGYQQPPGQRLYDTMDPGFGETCRQLVALNPGQTKTIYFNLAQEVPIVMTGPYSIADVVISDEYNNFSNTVRLS
ncbi:MAG: PEGA domain-containing protein [Dehalococcoidales bacterium]|nr:PEGA domain-containing protein [Dehalococcoidales bacterium]